MTIREVINKLLKYPLDTHLLIDSNGCYCELQNSDIGFIHKTKLNTNLVKSISNVINKDFEYIGAFKCKDLKKKRV